jgi:hypothetical protein
MNQKQRDFLIDKIKDTASNKCRDLKARMPKQPDIASYILTEIMSGRINIIEYEEIKKLIMKKITDAVKKDEDWTFKKNSYRYNEDDDRKTQIGLRLDDLFILPDNYEADWKEYRKTKEEIEKEINLITAQEETLIVRITLASNSTLESMIKEIDDMGNLSLMDTKLKALQ